jgi:hypothetical protein
MPPQALTRLPALGSGGLVESQVGLVAADLVGGGGDHLAVELDDVGDRHQPRVGVEADAEEAIVAGYGVLELGEEGIWHTRIVAGGAVGSMWY